MSDSTGASAAANWYLDPEDPSQYRYWDGTQWTDNRAPATVTGSAVAGAAPDIAPEPAEVAKTALPESESSGRRANLTARRTHKVEREQAEKSAKAASDARIRAQVDDALDNAVSAAASDMAAREIEWCAYAVGLGATISAQEAQAVETRIRYMLAQGRLRIGWRLIGQIPLPTGAVNVTAGNSRAGTRAPVMAYTNCIVHAGHTYPIDEFTSAQLSTSSGVHEVAHRRESGLVKPAAVPAMGSTPSERAAMRTLEIASPGWALSLPVAAAYVPVASEVAREVNRIAGLMGGRDESVTTQPAPSSAPIGPTPESTPTYDPDAKTLTGPSASAPPASPEQAASGTKIFVSHATPDKSVAVEVCRAMDARGCRTWLATRDVRIGKDYADEIYEALTSSTHFLVLLSPASVASEHVKRELNLAIEQGLAVFPLVVSPSADFMADLPSGWKYRLGVVQVVPYTSADAAADLVTQLLG